MKIGLIQLTSTNDIPSNIGAVEALVKEAASRGGELVALPENAFYMRAEGQGAPPQYTQNDHPAVKAAAAMAKRHGIWLLVGSVAVLPDDGGDGGKIYNRSLLFNPQGIITACYDKIHLFDVDVGDGQTYRESAKVLPGDRLVVAEVVLSAKCLLPSKNPPSTKHYSPSTSLGMTVCYDLRFPHLYRMLAKAGADILAVPSAFTQVTGEAHWHVLLRARAIENGCFVIAPAQCGTHPGDRKTFGHSLVIDPWGKVIADGGTESGVVMADIDTDMVKQIRAKMPSLQHDRDFKPV